MDDELVLRVVRHYKGVRSDYHQWHSGGYLEYAAEPPKTPSLELASWNATTIPHHLKTAIEKYCHDYYLSGIRYSENGRILLPNNLAEGGGCLLAAYVNSHEDGTHVVLFPPMIKLLLSKNMIFHSNLGIEGKPDFSVWRNHMQAIKQVANAYQLNELIGCLSEGKSLFRVSSHMRLAYSKLILTRPFLFNPECQDLSIQNSELVSDNRALATNVRNLTAEKNVLEARVETLVARKESESIMGGLINQLYDGQDDVAAVLTKNQVTFQKTPAKAKESCAIRFPSGRCRLGKQLHATASEKFTVIPTTKVAIQMA